MEEFKLLQKKENPLFERQEVVFTIKSGITPNKAEIEKIISEKFSTQPEKIAIKKIAGKFGSTNSKIKANIYSNSETKNRIESKKKKETKK